MVNRSSFPTLLALLDFVDSFGTQRAKAVRRDAFAEYQEAIKLIEQLRAENEVLRAKIAGKQLPKRPRGQPRKNP